MRGAHAGEALGLGFHHRAEGVAAVGALLLQVEAEGGQNGVRFTYPGVGRAGAGSPAPLACGAWAYTARHDAFSPCLCLVVDAVCAGCLGCGASFRSATSAPVGRA